MNVPTHTCPKLNTVGTLNAEMRLTPTTVPGRDHGSMMSLSTTPRPRNLRRLIKYAATTPKITLPTVAAEDMIRLLRIGARILGLEKSSM